MTVIDFHTHLDSNWFERPLIDRDSFIASMDRCGVDIACIFTLMGFYTDCPGANDRLAAHARAKPDRLVPFITVDPKLGAAAVEELERCLADPIFRGVKFHNWLQAVACSMVKETMLEVLRRSARAQLPLLFHDGTPPYSTTFQIADLARWVPEATIVLGHAGLADYVYPAGQLIRELPNLYACYCGPKVGDLRYLLEAGGAEKVLFGSDFGFGDWRMLAERMDDVYEAGLGPRELELVMGGNARRLLRLPESAAAQGRPRNAS